MILPTLCDLVDYAEWVNKALADHQASGLAPLPTGVKDLNTTAVGIWIDTIDNMWRVPKNMIEAKRRAQANNKIQVITFVVYDLPGRDCSASASSGRTISSQLSALTSTRDLGPPQSLRHDHFPLLF